jgi:hypothetical protein
MCITRGVACVLPGRKLTLDKCNSSSKLTSWRSLRGGAVKNSWTWEWKNKSRVHNEGLSSADSWPSDVWCLIEWQRTNCKDSGWMDGRRQIVTVCRKTLVTSNKTLRNGRITETCRSWLCFTVLNILRWIKLTLSAFVGDKQSTDNHLITYIGLYFTGKLYVGWVGYVACMLTYGRCGRFGEEKNLLVRFTPRPL